MWNKLFKSKSKTSKINQNATTSATSNQSTTQICGIVKNKSKFSNAFKSLSLKRNSIKNINFDHNNLVVNDRLLHPFKSDYNDDEIEEHRPYLETIRAPTIPIIPEPPKNLELRPCPICSRTFVPTTLVKHINICEKMQTKKRKTFDSSRQRREGTDLAAYLPKNFGLPQKQQDSYHQQQQTMRVSPPKTIVPAKKLSSTKTPTPERKEYVQNMMKDTPRPSLKRAVTQQLQNEQCPYCDRCFGMKAYDRHVEWCREKALINKNNMNTTTTISAAKERLIARIQYKAPNLKTKRQLNREKYSGSLSCGGSTNSLADLGTPLPRHRSHLNSMSSSMTSDSGLSDKYDPFLSAKRQLEELFSPTNANASTPKQPQTTNRATTPLTPIMSKSVTSKATPLNSNFRRTSSLRMPNKKISKPLFVQKTVKSNIQRGLSDDGPISPNFLRSSEYDEIPIKSVFNVIQLNDRPIMRDSNSISNRKNLKLDLKNPNNELPLSKTDSLAVFLKYENELNVGNPSLTEKELKDKSNTLSKRSSSMTNETKENVYQIPEEKIDKKLPDINLIKKVPQKIIPIKLEPINLSLSNILQKSTILTLDSIIADKSKEKADFIDPKLINLCDNLPVNATKASSDSDTSSGTLEILGKSDDVDNRSSSTPLSGNSSVYANERRNTLRRQVNLNKDLFDTSPASSDNKNVDDVIITNSANVKKTGAPLKTDESESIFEDFDFEEFISSFEDDDQYPIFKDYKNILMTRNNTNETNNNHKNSNNINRSDSGRHRTNENSNSTIQNLPNINDNNSSCNDMRSVMSDNNNNNHSHDHQQNTLHDDYSPAEKDLLKSVQELDRMCESSSSMYPVDSDEISSIEGYPLRRQTGSKLSADSAYGSLSRQSPPDQQQMRRTYQRKGSQDVYDEELSEKRVPQTHRARDNMSLSSSGSESSLPPISATLKTQKMELHPHKDKMDKLNGLMSKFCHDCGSRFTLNTAKFCMECGVRRIVLE